MALWSTEVILRNTETDEELDWVADESYSSMLKAIKAWFSPPRGPQYHIVFRVKHRPTGQAKEGLIKRHKRSYRVSVDSEMLTLAAANKKLRNEVYIEHCSRHS